MRREIMRTVADQFAETLAAAGVKRVYGIVGDSLNGLTDSLRRQGKIDWVHVRHEEVAAFAAGGGGPLKGGAAGLARGCGPRHLPLSKRPFHFYPPRAPRPRLAARNPSAPAAAR